MVSNSYPQERFQEHSSTPGSQLCPVHFCFDVSKFFILLVQALSFDQTCVICNLEMSFLEGQELSKINPYQINPNEVVTAQDKPEPKLEFQSIRANYSFFKTTVLTLQGKKREERSYLLSPSSNYFTIHPLNLSPGSHKRQQSETEQACGFQRLREQRECCN